MTLAFNFNTPSPTVAPIALRENEVGDLDTDPTVIIYGSDDFEIDYNVREGRTFGQLIETYAPTLGVTFDDVKMTLRKEIPNEGENPMVTFDTIASSGVYILSNGSDSKGNNGFDY